MNDLATITPIDYLIIGHITQDITPNGLVIGGTASYAGLTAKAFGIRVGIVTSCRQDLDLHQLDGIHDCPEKLAKSPPLLRIFTRQLVAFSTCITSQIKLH